MDGKRLWETCSLKKLLERADRADYRRLAETMLPDNPALKEACKREREAYRDIGYLCLMLNPSTEEKLRNKVARWSEIVRHATKTEGLEGPLAEEAARIEYELGCELAGVEPR